MSELKPILARCVGIFIANDNLLFESPPREMTKIHRVSEGTHFPPRNLFLNPPMIRSPPMRNF